MASWLTNENDYYYCDSDRYSIGKSSLPIMRPNRKRSSACAGLVDNFAEEFEQRLRLTPSALERLKVAEGFLKDPHFVLILMRLLPESCLRKLAVACSEWRTLAYKTLREKKGNNAFSNLWMDVEYEGPGSSEQDKNGFDFKAFFHHAYLGGSSMPLLLETEKENSCITMNDNNSILDRDDTSTKRLQIQTTRKVEFILTYGSSNMEAELARMANERDGKSMKSATGDCAALLVLSSSLLATTPDCVKTAEAVGTMEPDKKMMTSIMFPQCEHISFECFVVPTIFSHSQSTPAFSNVIGTFGSTKTPKVLLLYQYLNLIDSKPGIVEVLQSLQTTQGSAGFPMITGIYNYLDASLNMSNQSTGLPVDHVASGLLISGDNFCNVDVLSMKSLDAEDRDNHYKKIKNFYAMDKFTTKYALLFYHNELTNNADSKITENADCQRTDNEDYDWTDSADCEWTDDAGCQKADNEDCQMTDNADSKRIRYFDEFIDGFREMFPRVKMHGIGSLSGAHAMFVDPNSNDTFNQLNKRMMKLTGTVESKESDDSMELILVLLSYQAD